MQGSPGGRASSRAWCTVNASAAGHTTPAGACLISDEGCGRRRQAPRTPKHERGALVTRHVILALLSERPAPQHALRRRYDDLFDRAWGPMNSGQISVTLRRLQRDGLVDQLPGALDPCARSAEYGITPPAERLLRRGLPVQPGSAFRILTASFRSSPRPRRAVCRVRFSRPAKARPSTNSGGSSNGPRGGTEARSRRWPSCRPGTMLVPASSGCDT